MKYIVGLGLLIASLSFACQNGKTDGEEAGKTDTVVVRDTVVEKVITKEVPQRSAPKAEMPKAKPAPSTPKPDSVKPDYAWRPILQEIHTITCTNVRGGGKVSDQIRLVELTNQMAQYKRRNMNKAEREALTFEYARALNIQDCQ